MAFKKIRYNDGIVFTLGGLSVSFYCYGIYYMMIKINELIKKKKEIKLTQFEIFKMISFIILSIIFISLLVFFNIYYYFN